MSLLQPTKFLPFRKGHARNINTFISTTCLIAVNAQELLSSVACISAYAGDLRVLEIKDFPDVKTEMIFNGIQYTVFYFNDKYLYVIPTSFFPSLIDRTYFDCSHRYKVVRIGTPGHISIAIIDCSRKRIEIFDSSGKTIHTLLQTDILKKLQSLLRINYPLNFVNNTYLQDEDIYCQTWIYYYVFRRLLQNETAGAIISDLKKKTPMERFKAVQGLFNTLTST